MPPSGAIAGPRRSRLAREVTSPNDLQELSRPDKTLDRCDQTADIVSVAFNGTINVDIHGLLSPDER